VDVGNGDPVPLLQAENARPNAAIAAIIRSGRTVSIALSAAEAGKKQIRT